MKKDTLFVCARAKDNVLLSDMIVANSSDEARQFFIQKYEVEPESIFGPFFQKLTSAIKRHTEVKFNPGDVKKARYREWNITAMGLLSPEDSAFVIFDSRIDKQKSRKPEATVVKIGEIEFEEN